MKKKILSLFLALTLCLSLLPTAALAEGADDAAQETQSDPVVGDVYTAGEDPVPDEEARDKAVEAAQALIDALPDEVTADNAEEIEQRLIAIDEALDALTDKQAAQLDLTRYEALCEAPADLTAVQAEQAHTHFLCGGTDKCNEVGHSEHEQTTFIEWTDDLAKQQYGYDKYTAKNCLPKKPGSYYLTQNVSVDYWHPTDGTVLCLNGKTITTASAIKVDGKYGVDWDDPTGVDEKWVSQNFTLCDCKGRGEITRAKDHVRIVEVNSGTFNLYGGKLTNGYITSGATGENHGGGVLVYSNCEKYLDKNGTREPIPGTFNMYGGSITGSTGIFGGGVSVEINAVFDLYDGTISGNWAGGDPGYGGGVCVYGGTFNMSGGTISGGDSDKNVFGYGGGVYVNGDSYSKCGGVFNMSGGTISGNKTQNAGGGVYVKSYGSMTVSGDAKITGNKSGGSTVATATKTNNVYLPSGKTITVGGELKSGARIGVTGLAEKAVVANVAEGVTLTDADAAKFVSDDGNYEGKLNGNTVVLWKRSAHSHPLCGKTCADSTHTAPLTWTGVDSLGDIKGNGSYYLTQDVTINSTWTCVYDVKLCLNGHSITAGGNFDAIKVDGGKTFTLTDCNGSNGSKKFTKDRTGLWVQNTNGEIIVPGGVITHKSNKSSGGVEVRSGTFAMYGGTICGNSNFNGGGVCVYSGSTFNMYGGKVAGNTATNNAGNGGGVYVGGAFNMSGDAAISNNTASSHGGGVYVGQKASMTVSGSVRIRDNWKNDSPSSEGSANNLYLFSGSGGKDPRTVTIGKGGLTGASIGVTTASEPSSGKIQIATGAPTDQDYTKFFTPDVTDKGYTITQENGNLYLSTHQHDWEYAVSADDTTIVATCKGTDCTSKNGGRVVIRKPEHEVYGDGKSADAKSTTYDWIAGDVSGITYKKYVGDAPPLSAAPTDAGMYTASITVGDKTAYVDYTIDKATPQASDFTFAAPSPLAYDGTDKVASVTSAKTGMGSVTVKYYPSGTTEAPRNEGAYTVKIIVGEGTNYKAAETELTKDSWKFTIGKGDYRVSLTPKIVTIVKGRATAQTGTLTAADFFPAGQMPDDAAIASVTPTPGSGTMMEGVTVDAATHVLEYRSKTNITATADETYTVTIATTNYKDITATLTFRPSDKQAQTISFAQSAKAVTYGGPSFTQAVTGAATTVTYSSSDEKVATVDTATGEVTITGAGKTTITATAAETDDYAGDVATYELTVNKLRVAVPTAGKAELVYNGKEQTYTPAGMDTTYCEIADNTAKDVRADGTAYNAHVSLKDPANTEWDNGAHDTAVKPYSFRITPAPVTVTVLDKKITAGQAAPKLTSADYTITGRFGEGSLGDIALYYAAPSDLKTEVTPNTGKAGTYAIVAGYSGGTRDPNYDVTFVNGTLTIADRSTSSSGGGGGGSSTPTYPVAAPSKVENGAVTVSPRNASRGSTVTITVQPEDGFQLTGLTVTDKDGNERKLTDKGGGKYTFTMPGSKVEIKAVFAPEVETSPFADVAADAYYYEAVKWAKEQGITGGTGKGLFGSDQPCTRAQIVTFLWRAAGAPEPKAAGPFRDVVSGSYYEKAVAWAIENGITAGASATAFRPDAPCTRAQAVTFLARAAKAAASGSAGFRDVPDHAYYAEAVKWAADNGITSGIGKDRFGPDAHCTRAQIVTFLWRLYAGK